MSTQPGSEKILADNQLRAQGTSTVLGAAQAKGTATDLLLTIVVGPDGATAIAGPVSCFVEGSNVTASALTNWTTVAADKGTLPASYTTTAATNLHYQNLQFAFYRTRVQGVLTADVRTVYNFQPVGDSFDASVQ